MKLSQLVIALLLGMGLVSAPVFAADKKAEDKATEQAGKEAEKAADKATDDAKKTAESSTAAEPAKSEEPAKERFWKAGFSLAAGFPHVASGELDGMFWDMLSVGLSYGMLPAPPITGVTLSLTNFDLRARFHPTSASFFLGAILGRQTLSLSASATATVASQSVTATMAGSSAYWYVTPHLGWFKVTKIGLVIGFELGYQIPFGAVSTTSLTSSNSAVSSDTLGQVDAVKTVNSALNSLLTTLGTTSLPYITLLRLGWMF